LLLLIINFNIKAQAGVFQILKNDLLHTMIFQHNFSLGMTNSAGHLEFAVSLKSNGMAHPVKAMRFRQISYEPGNKE
jgi:hypothetical protein